MCFLLSSTLKLLDYCAVAIAAGSGAGVLPVPLVLPLPAHHGIARSGDTFPPSSLNKDGPSPMSWSTASSGRCADSGVTGIHAHLIGGNWVDEGDLAPCVPSLPFPHMGVADAPRP